MKSAMPLQQFKQCIILFIVSIGCSCLTYVIYITDPITMIVENNLQMSPHSLLFLMWKNPSLNIYLNVYIFNITNPVEFLSGKEKLKFQEIGPYVYLEYLINDNITYNDNDTLTYISRRTLIYVPEMSVGDPTEDLINVPNVPLLGVSSALSDAGFIVNYPIVQLANLMNAKPILNISVYDYLWGYNDPMVKLANGIVPNFIDFQKFGLLDRMYDEGENIVTMFIKKKADMMEEKGRYLSIDKYNGSPGMAQWGYVETESNETREENTVCNMIQGTTEGLIFPSHIDKRVIFRIFRKTFCRSLPIVFKKEVWLDGLSGYLYTFTDNFADPPDQNPENECFCRKKKSCLKKGLFDITPCHYHIPVAISFPHFLNADPSLFENMEGIKPDRDKHESYVILQPTTGTPIFCHFRMQVNLIMQRSHYNSKLAPFNDMTLPLFWFDLQNLSLPIYLTILLKLVQILPLIQLILMYFLGIIGVITSVLSLISIVWILNQQQTQEMTTNNDNPDVPLCNDQYTSIDILPTIRKKMSKTNCLIDN